MSSIPHIPTPADRIRAVGGGLMPSAEQLADKVAELTAAGRFADTWIAEYLSGTFASLIATCAASGGEPLDARATETLAHSLREAAAVILAADAVRS